MFPCPGCQAVSPPMLRVIVRQHVDEPYIIWN